MSQAVVKNEACLECAESKIVLDKLPEPKRYIEKVKTEKKPIKKEFLKLFKKAKYNAKYHEELIPIDRIKRRIHFKNTGLF